MCHIINMLANLTTSYQHYVNSFAEDKGYIFWSVVYFIGVWVIAFFEQIFVSGALFDYISAHEI